MNDVRLIYVNGNREVGVRAVIGKLVLGQYFYIQ